VKVLGSDLIEYFRAWPLGDDFCVEHCPFTEDEDGCLHLVGDGHDDPSRHPLVELGEKYEVEGSIWWQGSGVEPSSYPRTLGQALRAWLKTRDTKTFAVEVPVGKVEEFKALLASGGFKVK
jgi:hypothetical protein